MVYSPPSPFPVSPELVEGSNRERECFDEFRTNWTINN
jgi:hypothetical protein